MELLKNYFCSCGKIHTASVDEVICKKDAINDLPKILKKYNIKKPFVICDKNTFSACGEKVVYLIKDYTLFCFEKERLEPNEENVGSAILHFDKSCDGIVAIGSGVLNDISKIVSNVTNLPYIIVATAPSMDGFASKTSSMSRDGLKISLPSRCANVVIGDINVLKNAPIKMMLSGLGDMIAKYVSICEWRIAHEITGEYYCEEVANIIRKAVKKCVDNAKGLLNREENAVSAVFEGLILGGECMNYAGCSRPASGVEHYFSHVWDMRGLEFNTPCDFHGIQCALGTLYAVKLYEKILNVKIDKEKAIKEFNAFDYKEYCGFLRSFLGRSAESMVALESKEGKYDKNKFIDRLDIIISKWDKIKEIIKEELVPLNDLQKLYKEIGLPLSVKEIGLDESIVKATFIATKDIRDKYVLSRLCFDLGIIKEKMI